MITCTALLLMTQLAAHLLINQQVRHGALTRRVNGALRSADDGGVNTGAEEACRHFGRHWHWSCNFG